MKSPNLVQSFVHAWRGLRYTFTQERNFRIQVVIGLIVVAVMFLLPFAVWERVILLAVIMFVLVLELLNTSIEHLIDLVTPRLHQYVKEVKDVMAGAVLLASMFAAIIGAVIFWSHV
ncbi:diacylglycerol kinase family protein [Candidatus Uhrbacteria bacterium]|nr:diacylglycerol kinase family protein [Candidatus Uhrbacteria bacterium]